MTGKLYFTIGLPRSGKSKFCEKWIKGPFELQEDGSFQENATFNYLVDEITIKRPRIVISGDAFREALYGRTFQAESEGTIFAMMDVAARALLNTGHDVIIDETATTEQTILRYLRIDINAKPIFIEASLEECIDRAKKTNKDYLIKPIYRMYHQLEELKKDFDNTFQKLKSQVVERQKVDISI